jgi:hypothetical protein
MASLYLGLIPFFSFLNGTFPKKAGLPITFPLQLFSTQKKKYIMNNQQQPQKEVF